jgi:hypothetical protein
MAYELLPLNGTAGIMIRPSALAAFNVFLPITKLASDFISNHM